jgi:hypothetical protein
MNKKLTSLVIATILVAGMITLNIKAASLIKNSQHVTDTVVVVKLSDYRRLNQIVSEAYHGANDAQKLLWVVDLNHINSRAKQQIDTLKK